MTSGSLGLMETLTPEQAFHAMFLFLERYWAEFKTANLADVLGDIQPAEGGRSSDPAAWHDWLRAAEDATR
jgi:hypothetical protein